ncbi:MAG: hypothetical protein OXH63_28385 [Gemmatimonadetes bacterium]|nr:hypothetical protein [Gemmatimonadota bacterium]
MVRGRYLPADVGHDRWLNSSPYTVTIGEAQADDSSMATDPGSGAATPSSDQPEPTVTPDIRPADTYSLAHLATLPPPAELQEPIKPEHTLALRSSSHTDYGMWYPLVHLAAAEDVSADLTHLYNSRSYNVRCEFDSRNPRDQRLRCEYGGQGPLNRWGTDRLAYYEALNSAGHESVALASLTYRDVELKCEEQPERTVRTWWCYDPTSYSAWERAVAEALEPATDPLERYLRTEEPNPPVWYQASPYSGVGEQTTGLMRIEPYVRYEIALASDDQEAQITGRCAPISADGIVDWQNNHLAGRVNEAVTLRGTYLCEWTVEAQGAWTLTVE